MIPLDAGAAPKGSPLAAALIRLQQQGRLITALDEREDGHWTQASGQMLELAGRLADVERQLDDGGGGGSEEDPLPAPQWWRLDAAERAEAVDLLTAWVEEIFRPGYGHLAAGLGPCWPKHPLCLYALDVLASMWQVLYLADERDRAVLGSQIELQTRVMPAIAEQLARETTNCQSHPRAVTRR